MSDAEPIQDGELPLEGAGQTLRLAREKAKMSIAQIAAETRIPLRHLELIEAGDFAGLPARTYAIGFSRSYAKAVGLDDRKIADQVREELAAQDPDDRGRNAGFEPGDPARVPSRGLAWLTALAAILLVAGGFAYFRDYFMPGAGPGPLIADSEVTAPGEPADADGLASAPPANGGAVVFTALEDGVWAKFYDGDGNRLQEKQMAKGEKFIVPADVVDPQIWTGRPDLLAITIGGKAVPKLAEDDQIMRDIAISAKALQDRPATTAPAAVASPVAIASGAAPRT